MKRLLAVLAFCVAVPASAQRYDVAVLGGYTTPGAIEKKALGIEDLDLAGSFTWSVSAARFFSPRFAVELSWTHEGSALEIGTAQGSAEAFDVDLDHLRASFVYQPGAANARIRPFFTAGAGAAYLSAADLETETKLSLEVGAGLKWFPAPKVGARLQARYTPTYLHDSSSDFCDPFGFCQDWLHQFELSAGLVFRF